MTPDLTTAIQLFGVKTELSAMKQAQEFKALVLELVQLEEAALYDSFEPVEVR